MPNFSFIQNTNLSIYPNTPMLVFDKEPLFWKYLLLPLLSLLLLPQLGQSYPSIPIDDQLSEFEYECLGSLQVTLDENCSFILTPDLILTGSIDTIDSYVITIDNEETNLVASCGDHNYTITLIENDEIIFLCMGNLIVEDAGNLTLNCPDNTDYTTIRKEAWSFTDSLVIVDRQIELSDYSCFDELATPGLHYYKTYPFSVNETGVYTFIGELIDPNFEAVFTLLNGTYTEVFELCAPLLAQNVLLHNSPQNSSLTLDSRLTLALTAGEEYTLMVSSYSTADVTGEFNIYAFAENDGGVNNWPIVDTISLEFTLPLICNDLNDLLFMEQQHYMLDVAGVVVNNSMSDEVSTKLNYTGFPMVGGYCGTIDVWVKDTLIENGDCGTWVVNRMFSIANTVDDPCSSGTDMETCIQSITIRKPTLDDVVLPARSVLIECDSDYPTDGEEGGEDENPTVSVTGYPLLMTSLGFHEINQTQCNIGAAYSDEPRINICDASYKYVREWNLINWCVPANTRVFEQIVKVGDYVGPSFRIEVPDYNNDGSPDLAFRISKNPFSCEASWFIPPAEEVIDGNGCSGIASVQVTVRTSSGDFVWIGSEGTLIQIPSGDYNVVWCVEDNCGNETCEGKDLIVRDEIEPVAVCDAELSVSIGGGDILNGVEGLARVFATDIDDGSYDNCGEVSLAVRRNHWENESCDINENEWSDWGDYVDFYCCDVGQEINVELRVTDGVGNTSFCWLIVTPEDKLVPYCYAPMDITIANSELPEAFPDNIEQAYEEDLVGTSAFMNDLFGAPSGTDNCAVDRIVERSPVITVNDCGWGIFMRRFEVWQWRPEGDVNNNGELDREEAWVSTNTCTQLINITETHEFIIDFPQDVVTDCEDFCIWDITTESIGNDIIAVNIGDATTIEATGGECYQLTIKYDVINWCLWDGQYEGYTIERMTDIENDTSADSLTVESTERPVLFGSNDGVVLRRSQAARTLCPDGSGGFPTDDDSLLPETICQNGDDQNPGLCRGRWNYTQHIMVYNELASTITVGDFGGPSTDTEELCPDLDLGQFCAPFSTNETAVSIPITVNDGCELMGIESDPLFIVFSAELDLFAVDANGDGVIDDVEFSAEPGAIGEVSGNVVENSNGNYDFTGSYPIILEEDVYHAVRIVFSDPCGNQVSELIQFEVILGDEMVAVEDIVNLEGKLKLYQNIPNPFTDETTIVFDHPNFGEVLITFADLHGREITNILGHYSPGLNEVKVRKHLLNNTTGIIFYTVTSGSYSATKKMILLD